MFAQQVINGLMAGSAYSLLGLGFTLIFGILNVINIAHPEVFMVGAFLGWMLVTYANANLLVAIVGATIGASIVGVLIERIAIRPVRSALVLSPFISTAGVSIFLQQGAARVFSPEPQPYPPSMATVFHDVGGLQFSTMQVISLAVGAALMIGLKLFVDRTWLGRAIRATAMDRETASLMGVNVNTVVALTLVIASALAAVAGVLVSVAYNSTWAFMGITYGLKGMAVMVVGGVGSLEGAMAAGLILGVAEALTVGYISSSYRDGIAFIILTFILLLRPSGLFGQRERQR
ncbi:MAG: branched-chain amino acid ABC transporter permease [Chloroflexi bacterium]|nr:branched-chain amino acid ABC transporter permease [Chloroflexota bacterium]MBI4507306.1 branched-chain amino acid ABC transporter permease [Chloroflexota bacterium]